MKKKTNNKIKYMKVGPPQEFKIQFRYAKQPKKYSLYKWHKNSLYKYMGRHTIHRDGTTTFSFSTSSKSAATRIANKIAKNKLVISVVVMEITK